MMKSILWIILGSSIIGSGIWIFTVSNVEEAKYEVIKSQGNLQIRDYAPMIIAETEVTGERKEAIRQGFRIIANYIFGNNTSKHKVAMTAPVIQEKTENNWKIRFVMPAGYTLNTLPKPNNKAVHLKQIDRKRFATIMFSGTADEEGLKKYNDELIAFIKDNNLKSLSQANFAFYNPPWTPPFLRRNEVLVEIAK